MTTKKPLLISYIYSIPMCVIILLTYSCKTKSKELVPPQNNTVIVDLKKTATPNQIISEFNTISLSEIKKLSNALNIYLFSFDANQIDIDSLIVKLKKSDHVENAQSNKKTNTRN
ncbi:hypothetical protein [uncultured Dokdonia sp.]|uniref:hypothetical protein n=1 Tax=uncultured Dokdonia sp. TaxID=575653 RepID=UPI0026133BD5|nr:hypothetical protein [uncultured Dokdonia sp.]